VQAGGGQLSGALLWLACGAPDCLCELRIAELVRAAGIDEVDAAVG
jgi:hypothetical protein